MDREYHTKGTGKAGETSWTIGARFVPVRRREFLAAVAVSSGAVVLAPPLWRPAAATSRQGTEGPYGSIEGREPDENGLLLPEGFTSRVIARSGEVVEGSDYRWPVFPDGAATFAVEGGGWYLAVNSENFVDGEGGASAIGFDAEGGIVDAFRILEGTTKNCGGGPTPWGTWLSGEEIDDGLVWECDPTGESQGEPRPALGSFSHEAVTVDPDLEQLYLTEDEPDGRLYRFTPDAYPDLSAGSLEVARVDGEGVVTWLDVPDPSGATVPTRGQVPDSTAFDGGEGIWFDQGSVYFTSKGDDNVRRYDTDAETIEVIYDGSGDLTGVDNITAEAGTGDLFVAEDGGNMEVVVLTPEGEAYPFVRIVDDGTPAGGVVSEITGPAFSPDGSRLFFGSQRGGAGNAGVNYEVTGPFRASGPGTAGASTATTLAATAPSTTVDGPGGEDDGGSMALPVVGGAMALGLVATGVAVWHVRTRRSGSEGDESAGSESR